MCVCCIVCQSALDYIYNTSLLSPSLICTLHSSLLYARSLNEACVVVAGPLIKYINEYLPPSLSTPPLLYARSLNEACVVVAGPFIKYINESIHPSHLRFKDPLIYCGKKIFGLLCTETSNSPI